MWFGRRAGTGWSTMWNGGWGGSGDDSRKSACPRPRCHDKQLGFILNCSVRKNVINFLFTKNHFGDFPGGPVVNNPACHAGDVGLIPGQGTKIPHAFGTTKPMHHNEKILHNARMIPLVTTMTWCSQINKWKKNYSGLVSKEQEVEVGGPAGRQLKSPGPEGSQSQSGWRKKDSVRYAGDGLHRIQKYGEATMGESVSAPWTEEQSSLTPHVLDGFVATLAFEEWDRGDLAELLLLCSSWLFSLWFASWTVFFSSIFRGYNS